MEVLNKYAKLTEGKKILAITETHFMKDQHMDPEALKYIPGFKLYRTDRDIDHDEDALSKWGGTMILAGPDVNSNKVEEYCYSNGNCEMTVAEFSELKMAIQYWQ